MRFTTLLVFLLLTHLNAYAEGLANPDPSLPPPMDAVADKPVLATPDPLIAPKAPEPAPQAAAPDTLKAPEPALPTPAYNPATANTATPATDNLAPPEGTLSDNEMIDRQQKKEQDESAAERRSIEQALVRHEGGTFHIETDYANKPFASHNPNIANVKDPDIKGAEIHALFFPISHGIGRFGIGPEVGWYQGTSDLSIDGYRIIPTFIAYGAEATYQFNYSIGQILVPYATAGLERVSLSYKASDGLTARPANETFSNAYWIGGLAINLNRLEHRTAAQALVDTGVRKFYLVGSYKQPLKAGRTGNALLGLRFEF